MFSKTPDSPHLQHHHYHCHLPHWGVEEQDQEKKWVNILIDLEPP